MGIELGAKNLYKAYGVPSLDLTFADKKSLVDRISGNNLITFTRSSTATYVGSDGLIQTAASGAARFDHNPTTGESLGLLVEEARTNFVRQSETFGTTWTLFRASIVADSTASPDGAATADTMVEDTTVTSSHGTVQTINLTAATYTFTIFLKAAGRNWVNINPSDSTDHRTWFDFSNGVVGTNAAGNTSSIKAYPNGWYRCTITRTMDQVSCAFQISLTTGDNVAVYSGDGTSGAYIWGAQIEAGAFPTSYIPTSGSTVTRAADVASMTGSNFSSWFNQSAGSLFGSFVSLSNGANAPIAAFSQTSNPEANRISLRIASSFCFTNSVVQFSFPTSYTANQSTKVAWGFGSTATYYKNGTLIGTDSSVTLPATIDIMTIGTLEANAGFPINGTIARLTFYPVRLPDATLQSLTQ
jgi:hypothetical protein